MVMITDVGADIVRACIKEFEVAEEKDKLHYAQRMAAKIEAVMDMSIETTPMAKEDINNVALTVTGKPAAQKEEEIRMIKELRKAGKNPKEIAKETGRKLKDIVADINFIDLQAAK